MKKITGIYKITSPSGKVYIGQSWNIKLRWRNHGKSKHTSYLYSSIVKYGKESHNFEIVHELPVDCDQKIMNQYEQLYMDLYRNCGIGLLNLKEGGGNGKPSEESKRKTSETMKGMVANNKGVPHSEEHRLKISIANKGRKPSEKAINALIERNQKRKGQPSPNKGKKITEEQSRKLSERQRGRKLKPESIAKRTKSFLERLTPESRKRRSETMKKVNANIRQKKLSLMVNQLNLSYALQK